MKLYELAPTPSCKRLNIFLNELGIKDLERVPLDLRGGDNLTDDYRLKSINAKVPMLEIDAQTRLSETVAICRYFDEITPNSLALFGEDALEKAQVEMWHRIVELEGVMVAFQAFRNISQIYKDRETCVSEWGSVSKTRLEAFFPKLDKQLQASDYVASNRFSIVDITAFVLVGFASAALELEICANYENIQRWYEQVSSRASVQSV
jgi:glutathione S-transferase